MNPFFWSPARKDNFQATAMRLTTLVAGILCCALLAGAQDPVADDYADYYYDDLALVDATAAKTAAVPAVDGATKGAVKDEMPTEEEVAEVSVTEAVIEPTTTTTEASAGRRKLVSLKSTKINRNRSSRPRPSATEAPNAEHTSNVAEETTAKTPARGSPRLRGRGRTSARSQPEVAAQEAEEPVVETQKPSRGRFRPSTSSNRSFRPASRGSSNTATEAPQEESKTSSSSRFRPSTRSSFRPSSSPKTEEPEESTTSHRFSTSRRGRGNSRGGSAFRTRGSQATEPEADLSTVEPVAEESVTENTRRSRFGSRGRR